MDQREPRAHLHQQKARRDAKTHHVAQTVQLGAEIAGGTRQPGHVAVQSVKNHRQKNQPAAEHHCSASSAMCDIQGLDVRLTIRAATTMAKNPQIRFPSVNRVGKTAIVRMGRMERARDWGLDGERTAFTRGFTNDRPLFYFIGP